MEKILSELTSIVVIAGIILLFSSFMFYMNTKDNIHASARELREEIRELQREIWKLRK